MVINLSTHSPDNHVQGSSSVGVVILPQEVSQSFQLRREAVLPAGKLQPAELFARSSPVAGKPQKVLRRKTFSSLISPHRRYVTHSKEHYLCKLADACTPGGWFPLAYRHCGLRKPVAC